MIKRSTRVAILAGMTVIAQGPRTIEAQARGTPLLRGFSSETDLARYLRTILAARYRASTNPPCKYAQGVEVDSTLRGTGTATVTGVVDDGTAPLGDARVSIPPMGLVTSTADNGAFKLVVRADSLASSRTISVQVRRIGFQMRSVDVAVSRGDRVTMRVPLCQMAIQLQEVVTSAGAGVESITNNQHDGVDEGDIVKRHGDYLVILRRGRLYTVDVGRGRLSPVSMVNAYGAGIDASGDWYDEMLIAKDRVVIVGYSYRRGGTELGIFRIERDGHLEHEATYDLRSNDYYSSRNYAARLVGTHLIFYSPLVLRGDSLRPLDALPSWRRWQNGGDNGAFRPMASIRQVYRFADADSATGDETLHTVTTCDLALPELECESAVVIGPASRSFYVSPNAVYVATAGPPKCRGTCPARFEYSSSLVRMPLDGGSPTAIATHGTPIDQFSFLERDGMLNVLLQDYGLGDGMWRAEHGVRGGLALLRLPVTSFADGMVVAPPSAYRTLPTPVGHDAPTNRFVADHLLYGTGSSWGRPNAASSSLVVVPMDGTQIAQLDLSSGVDRIEAMGDRAVVVGSDENAVHFTAIQLGGRVRKNDEYVVARASQGELRSHGFFYKPDGSDADRGTLGLPVRGAGQPGWKNLVEESASIIFLRSERGEFRPIGRLDAHPTDTPLRDGCVASCVDWYGNSRPLFVDDRVFALLGYEIVEGRLERDGIREIRRAMMLQR